MKSPLLFWGQRVLLCAPTYARPAPRARGTFCVTSFSFKKEVTKKVNQAVPSWNSPTSRRFKINGGDFAFAKVLPLGGRLLRAVPLRIVGSGFCSIWRGGRPRAMLAPDV